MSEPFPPIALRRRHAQTVKDSYSSYKIDDVIILKTFLNPEGHQNCSSGSEVTAILRPGMIMITESMFFFTPSLIDFSRENYSLEDLYYRHIWSCKWSPNRSKEDFPTAMQKTNIYVI